MDRADAGDRCRARRRQVGVYVSGPVVATMTRPTAAGSWFSVVSAAEVPLSRLVVAMCRLGSVRQAVGNGPRPGVPSTCSAAGLLRMPPNRDAARLGTSLACAGTTASPTPHLPSGRDQPRMCGDDTGVFIDNFSLQGPAPACAGRYGDPRGAEGAGRASPASAGTTSLRTCSAFHSKGPASRARGRLSVHAELHGDLGSNPRARERPC